MRKLVLHPDAILRRRADSVDAIDGDILSLVTDMIGIMKQERGLGLAAPQVGSSKRIFVTEGNAKEGGDEKVFINPKFLLIDGLLESHEEGCLSLLDIRGTVRRQPHVIVEALDIHGKTFTMEGVGLIARCWQHEMDHLDGVLIIDRMSAIDRIVNRKRLRALESMRDSD
ncbi:MAG: peptide deformylase [Planctomycetota bacterium]|nr:peptide deformylase [Planctomycetota bacterium]